MKILKYLAIIIVLMVVAWLVASMLGPKTYKVERTAIINANDSITHSYLAHFQKWPAWSPWNELDPKAHYSIAGVDGTKGAAHTWEGEITGNGTMTWTEVTPSSLKYDLVFVKPWQSKSSGGFTIQKIDDSKTKVSWYDTGDLPFNQRAFMLIMSMDKFMGPQFERGLFKIDSLAKIDQLAINSQKTSEAENENAE